MKVLAVLVLAVFSSCQANGLHGKINADLEQHVDDLKASLLPYYVDLKAEIQPGVQLLKQELGTYLESVDYGALKAIVMHAREELVADLKQHVGHLKASLRSYYDDLKAKIHQRVELLKQKLANYVESVDVEALKATVMRKGEELKAHLEHVDDLEASLRPYYDDLKAEIQQGVKLLKQKLGTYLESGDFEALKATVMDKGEEIMADLNQHVDDLKASLRPYYDDLKAEIQPGVALLKQELGTYLQSVDVEALKATVMEEGEEIMADLKQHVGHLKASLRLSYDDLKADMQQRVQQRVQLLKQKLPNYVESVDVEALKATMMQVGEKLMAQLE